MHLQIEFLAFAKMRIFVYPPKSETSPSLVVKIYELLPAVVTSDRFVGSWSHFVDLAVPVVLGDA